ncbi:sensor histidine kinase [Marivirga harenae]|uniref:sensor histidine kinase n=1 Tax=Marivirga harenae TaxID=2010992 RepID=UPI0026DFB256|nr:HAMP domain-containing sensor histidine kinase [Marivirga harenae]WKV13124.1 HAMP domain-containing sensor histidine kinase [Marivirga harenae]
MIDQSLFKQYFENILVSYSGQALWGIGLALILWYFFNLYQRKHLQLWSYSWVAFASFVLFSLLTLFCAKNENIGPFWQNIFTFLFQIAGLMHVVWLLQGTYHLIQKKSLSLKQEYILYVLVIFIALISSLFYLLEEEGGYIFSLIVPFTIKSLIVGIAFIFAGVQIMRIGRRDSAVGKKLLWISFLLYGFENLNYALGGAYMIFEENFILEVNTTLGVIDFLLLSFIGIGMIIWLLEEERSALEKTNRELDSFLYSTSHDLRAPVASLLGLINIAKHDIKEESGQQYVKMMEERVKKLDHIFGDILNYSRNIKTEINLKTFRLGEMVEDIITDVKFNQGADSIRLDYDEQIHHTLRTDYYQLKVVLGNLISNAVKYHDAKKPDQFIAIRFEKVDRDVHISVEDNGIGIAAESQHKVFDMFYRATSEAEGSGLGLFIVQQALEKISARITLVSELGKGSIFKVIIENAGVKLDD